MLLWGVVIGIGTGMTALVLGATISARWFVARRGLVVGILTASVGDRSARVPAAAGDADRSLRLAHRAGADLRDARRRSVLPCSWSCATGRATSACDRSETKTASRCRAPPPKQRAYHGGGPRRAPRTLRSRACFWVLFATFFICGATTNGLIQVHLIPMCLDYGIPQVQARQPARRDGHLRLRRHHRLGLAVGPLRHPQTAVLVLRSPRPVAAVAAVQRLLVLRPVAVCRFLRARLGPRRCRRRYG